MAVKRKKKNKFLPMIVLLAVLAALIIGTSLLSAANEKKAAEEAAKLAAENTAVMLAEYDAALTQSISYSREGADFITLTAKNGAWIYADDPDFPLNQTIAGYMASALSSMAATRTVDQVDMDAYGLTDPAYVIKVSYSDGTSHVYTIGAQNSFSGDYYFTMDGDCYMISAGLIPYFNYALTDLLALDLFPAAEWQDIGYVNSVTVTKDGVSNVITDEAGMTGALETMDGLALNICRDYHADEAEKAAYGLDGSNSVTVKYKKAVASTDEAGSQSVNYLETSYTLLIGEDFCGNPQKSDIVYQLDETAVTELLAYADYAPAGNE